MASTRVERRGVPTDEKGKVDNVARIENVGPGEVKTSEEEENATSAPESDSHVRTYTPRSCHHRPHFHTPGSWTHTHLPRTYTAALAGASRGAGPHITARPPGERKGPGLEAKPRIGAVGTAGSRGTRVNESERGRSSDAPPDAARRAGASEGEGSSTVAMPRAARSHLQARLWARAPSPRCALPRDGGRSVRATDVSLIDVR